MSYKNKDNIVDKGVSLLLESNEQLPLILRQRDEELNKLECENRQIGDLIETYGLKYLIDLLTSSSEYFDEEVSPEDELSTIEDRPAFVKIVKEHSRTCEKCILRVKHSQLFEEEVETGFAEHRSKKLLEETSNEPKEIDHPPLTGKPFDLEDLVVNIAKNIKN